MLSKTRGIVLNHIKYKESSIIVRIYTRELGLKSYIVNSVRSKSKTSKISLYQPLNILDLVVYTHHQKDIQRISETTFYHKPVNIPFEVNRSTVALFLTEWIGKTITEHDANTLLYDFLEESIIEFDSSASFMSEYHIYMVFKMLDFLGYALPHDAENVNISTIHGIGLNKQFSNLNGKQRQDMLHFLVDFYKRESQININLKSLPVLESIFH